MKRCLPALLAVLCASVLNAAPRTRTILVFPFENQSSSSDLGWISEAFAQVFSWRMQGPGRYALGRSELNGAYQLAGIPPDATLTLASEYKVAETLGVDWAVTGSFKVANNIISARAQILNMPDLRLTPAVETSAPLTDMISMQTRMVWQLLKEYDAGFQTSEIDFQSRFRNLRPDSFENYIRGILANDGPAKVKFLETAAQLDSTDHRPDFALGQYYFRKQAYARSAVWLAKLDPTDPDYLTSIFLDGVDDFFLGRYPLAEAAFETLSRQMPLGEVWTNLGVVQERLGRARDALSSFTKAYQADPTNAAYAFNLGACYSDLEQYKESSIYLQKAESESPADLGVRTLLAYVLEKTGDLDAGRSQLRWVAEHDGREMGSLNASILPQPRIQKTYNGKAFRLLWVAVHNSSEVQLAKLPPQAQGQGHLTRGESLLKRGLYAEAIRELAEAHSLLPDSGAVHLLLGEAYELEGQHQLAIAQFHAALGLVDSAVAHQWLAHAYLSLRQYPEAQVEAEEALSLDPHNPDSLRLLQSIRQQMPSAGKEP